MLRAKIDPPLSVYEHLGKTVSIAQLNHKQFQAKFDSGWWRNRGLTFHPIWDPLAGFLCTLNVYTEKETQTQLLQIMNNPLGV